MISSVNALSSSSISCSCSEPPTRRKPRKPTLPLRNCWTSPPSSPRIFAGANAIGKIIEIVAGMSQSNSTLFTMDGAERIDGSDGEYSLTKTGTGTVGADANDISGVQETAKGSGPEAERAKSSPQCPE